MVSCILIAAGVGTVLAVVAVCAVPAVLAALGFTTGGIAAGSLASSMMSYSALNNGGGVAAGGVVAILQSVGAAGIYILCRPVIIFAIVGAVAGAIIGGKYICIAGAAGNATISDAVSTVASLIANYNV